MPHLIAWCGFLGAWLLVAGPLDQAVREIEEQGFEHEAFDLARAKVEEPEPVSRWWLLLPPAWWLLKRRRESIYRHQIGEALDDEALLAFLTVKDILNAWLYVAVGASLIAVKETWELHESYEWPEWTFWLGVVGMVVFSVSITVGRTRRRRRRPEVTARQWAERLGEVARGVREGDEREVARAVEALSRRHRLLAPLALLVGGVAMLFGGVRLLLTNWRLTAIQIPPAMWIWAAMYDLRGHVLHDRTVQAVTGLVVVPIVAVVAAITMACFWLNAVFGFAISQDGKPEVRPAIDEARRHLPAILGPGAFVGLALGLTVTVVTRTHAPWFTLTLSIVIGVMMVAYVAVPARLIGVEADAASRRDRLSASVVGSVLGAVVSTPAYVLGRIGLLMLGSPFLRLPGLLIFIIGFALQAGATSAVKAVKMGAKLGGRGAPAPPVDEVPLPPR